MIQVGHDADWTSTGERDGGGDSASVLKMEPEPLGSMWIGSGMREGAKDESQGFGLSNHDHGITIEVRKIERNQFLGRRVVEGSGVGIKRIDEGFSYTR